MKNPEEINLEKLELLVQSKSFAELSHEEKEWVSQWVESGNDYDMLRKSETQMRQYFLDSKVNPPTLSTLTQLTSHLRKKARGQQIGLRWQFKPSLSAWALAIVFGCVGWWIGQSTTSPVTQSAGITSAIIHDTIYIASKPDTIVTEKVIYRDRPVILTKSVDKDRSSQKLSQPDGINMKEKEELEKLLVSGTD